LFFNSKEPCVNKNPSLADEQVFTNFAMQISIEWTSSSGLAGCGLILRAEDDLDNGEQYRFYTLRLSGAPLWDVELWNYSDFQSSTTGGTRQNQAIKLEDDSVNRYTLVAQGTTLTIYANGKRLGAATLKASRNEGRIGAFTFQESGVTTCTISDGWIYNLP
jgi:hypothetical protein